MNQGSAQGARSKEDRMSEVVKYEQSERFTAREKLALSYADAIMWAPEKADDEMWKRLHAEFTEPQIVEIGYWIGFIFGGQRWLRTLQTQAGELAAFLAEKKAEKAKP
jgi:alkylhydroperoxidase family enzyme